MELTPLRLSFVRSYLGRLAVSLTDQRGFVEGRTTLMELEPEAAEQLSACEVKIQAALDGAWTALKQIHDDKLYKVAGLSPRCRSLRANAPFSHLSVIYSPF